MTVFVCKRVILLIVLWTTTSEGVDIDSKLDFEAENPYSASTSDNIFHKKVSTPTQLIHNVTVVSSTNKPEKLGFICGEGGCNKIKSTDSFNNHIKTDVLVHIETKLDLEEHKQSNKQQTEEIPDIPVIFGYKGAKLDETTNDNFRVKPVLISRTNPVEDHTRTNMRTTFYGVPVIGKSDNFLPNLHKKSSFVPFRTYGPSYRSNSEDLYNKNNGSSYPTSINSGNEPVYPSNSFINQEINVNIKTLPPIAVSFSNDDEVYPIHMKYKNNGTRITVPYFEQSFHSHYYGENPPPPYVWYSKSTTAKNNVEFRTTQPIWSPSQWFNSANQKHTFTNDGQATKCFCQTGSDNTPLSWYPSARQGVSINSGSHIDDKLAPLN